MRVTQCRQQSLSKTIPNHHQLSIANTSCDIRGVDSLVTFMVWSKTSGESHQKYACTYVCKPSVQIIETHWSRRPPRETRPCSFRPEELSPWRAILLGTEVLNDTWCNLNKNTQPCQDWHWASAATLIEFRVTLNTGVTQSIKLLVI